MGHYHCTGKASGYKHLSYRDRELQSTHDSTGAQTRDGPTARWTNLAVLPAVQRREGPAGRGSSSERQEARFKDRQGPSVGGDH